MHSLVDSLRTPCQVTEMHGSQAACRNLTILVQTDLFICVAVWLQMVHDCLSAALATSKDFMDCN